MFTVKQLSDLAGITNRTLHYYDEIGLLKPTALGANGYRYYDEEALFRLQQILFYRDVDLDLMEIKRILDDPQFDLVSALQSHRQNLEEKINRLQTLIQTVDTTIMQILGEIKMSNKKLFEGFSPEQEKQYGEEATTRWGDSARQSINFWNSYSEQKKQEIMKESNAIYSEILAHKQLGPESPEIQAMLVRWHQHLRYFYEPSLERLRGLGEMYNDDPKFNATFTAMHPDLPAFLKKAISFYVDNLEGK